MGGGRGIGLNGGDKLGWGGDRHGEGDERRAQGRGGAHDKPSTTGADKPRARHTEGDGTAPTQERIALNDRLGLERAQ